VVLAALTAPVMLRAATTDVGIVDFAYSPANVTINVGDTVHWVNNGSFPHTSTSGVSPTPDGIWDSGLLGSGASYSRTFDTAGTFPYFCTLHTFMTGTVTVQGGNMPPTVSIDSPTNGASFISPADVTISATASDGDGSVSQVEFFDGTNSLGTDVSSAYEVTATLYKGSHSLTAVATDNQGASGTSAVVTVSVTTMVITNPIAERIPKGDRIIELRTVLDGLVSPLGLANPDDGSGRMFVFDQAGKAWVATSAGALPTPLLDVSGRLVPLGAYDERGLLGLATHPDFANHPFIYTYTSEPVSGLADFTDVDPPNGTNNCQSVIAEWRIDPANTNQVDVSSRRELLRIDKPYFNHNGGTLAFGPDGMLYISLGDGGRANDTGGGHVPGGNAQSLQQIYGSLLRIDVDGTNSANGQYGVPADNPFVGQDAVEEIYAYGLRNPYRYSFDRMTGDLYLGDAGQNKIEEVDLITKGGNYGWNVKEGSFFFDPDTGNVVTGPVRPVPAGLVDPIAEYDHDDGFVVVGGFVYRGSLIPELQGRYVFGDFGSFGRPTGRLFYLDTNSVIKEFQIGLENRPLGYWIKGFGEDSAGELYVMGSRTLGPGGQTGAMLKIVPAPASIQFTGVQNEGGTNLAASWTGGTGPFALQKKTVLPDATWMNAAFSLDSTAETPLEGDTGFFRVGDTAHTPAVPFTAALSGDAERPTPVATGGSGSGIFCLDGNTLRFSIGFSGLSGPATAAHIHGPADTAHPAGVELSLAPFATGPLGTSGSFSGAVVISDTLKAQILAGLTYVNVHTANNPAGEIRGQIAPVLMQASLRGEHETSSIDTTGHALGEFFLIGTQLTFNITYRDLSSAAIGAHIHGPASMASNAPVLISLEPFNSGSFGTGGTLAGTVDLTPEQLGYVIDGLTYVNIHTAPHSGGEIRGQILPQTVGIPASAWLTGLAERPDPVSTSGSGAGLFSLEGNTLRFSIVYSNLSAVASAAHIHGPATTDQPAGVQISLQPFNGGAFGTSGTFAGSVSLTDAQRDMVLAGQTYVNIHTPNNPTGEIRGQIAPALMQASLSGVNERPNSVVSDGTAYGAFLLAGDQLTLNISYQDLSGTATGAHIHGPASLFAPAGVLVDLSPFNGGSFGDFGNLAGTTSLSLTNLNRMIDGTTYVNFHTAAHTDGEIRGQITR